MENNNIEMFRIIIDIIGGIIVPIILSIIIPTIIALRSRKDTKIIVNSRLDHLEKQVREHLRGFSDEEQELIDKTLKEVFSRPLMRV